MTRSDRIYVYADRFLDAARDNVIFHLKHFAPDEEADLELTTARRLALMVSDLIRNYAEWTRQEYKTYPDTWSWMMVECFETMIASGLFSHFLIAKNPDRNLLAIVDRNRIAQAWMGAKPLADTWFRRREQYGGWMRILFTDSYRAVRLGPFPTGLRPWWYRIRIRWDLVKLFGMGTVLGAITDLAASGGIPPSVSEGTG